MVVYASQDGWLARGHKSWTLCKIRIKVNRARNIYRTVTVIKPWAGLSGPVIITGGERPAVSPRIPGLLHVLLILPPPHAPMLTRKLCPWK